LAKKTKKIITTVSVAMIMMIWKKIKDSQWSGLVVGEKLPS
jgi:hypothetical protein